MKKFINIFVYVAGMAVVLAFIGGFDSSYYNGVQETLKMPFVRFFGVLIFSATLGGALYFIMENLTATAEYPAKYDELLAFIVVFALFGVIIYYLVRLVVWLFRKMVA